MSTSSRDRLPFIPFNANSPAGLAFSAEQSCEPPSGHKHTESFTFCRYIPTLASRLPQYSISLSFCVSSRPAYSNCDECFHLPLKVSTTRAHKKTMNLPPRHDPKCEVRWVESTLVLRKLTTAGGVVCSRGNLELSEITNISVCDCCAGKWLSAYVFLIATPAHGRPQTER